MHEDPSVTIRNRCHVYVDQVPSASLPALIWLLVRLIPSTLNEQYQQEKKSR